MKQQYQDFKKEILTRDKHQCQFCGSKAIHTIYLDSQNSYNSARYYLTPERTLSVCLKCYYVKLKSTTQMKRFQQKIWTNKK